MSQSLLNKKSSLTSRRNIIIYIIATILILGTVAGFTNVFHTDNRRFAAKWGETIVMESQPPATGSPADYDLLSNLQYTAYKIHHSKYFKGYTEGKVSADIGVGSYTQYLTNTRVVYNQNIVFTETISSSSLKSLAEQKYADNGIIIYRSADKINGNKATFSSTAQQMSYEQYSKNYGTVPNQLSKYIINKNTILSVKDENAGKAPRLNSGGDSDGDVDFDVPESLVQGADGNYVFTLSLDPTTSSLYYRNEVRTLGGADQNPKFYSVKITVTVNSEWIPISTRTLEEYDIEIPVLGAMRCSGDNLETFSMIDDENGEIPEKDFFQPYVDQAKKDPTYKPPEIDSTGPLSASDYLAAAFADYLSGKKNLDLTANVNIDGIPAIDKLSANNLKLSINLDTLDIQAMLGSGLYVKYASDKVYVKNNDINGYVSTAAAKELTKDPILKGLLTFGELDTNKIFGGDMLDVIFKDCEMTEEDGVTTIPMSFSLDLSDIIPALDEVQVVASIKINSEDKSLNSIAGNVLIGDTTIKIKATPLKSPPSFPSVDGAEDLSGLLDFVPDIAATAMQKTYGIDGTLTLNDMTVGLSAYVDRTDTLTAEATLNVEGIDVLVKYIDGTIYATALGVNVRGTTEELPELLNALLDVTGFDKYQTLFKVMLPSSVNQIADMLNTLTVDGNTLGIGMDFIGMPIDVTFTRGDGKLKSIALGVNVDLFGIKADIAADLNISEPAVREVTAPETEDALTFADLATLIKQAKPYLDADYYTAEIDGYATIGGTRNDISGSFAIDKVTDKDKNVTGVAAAGSLCALGQDIAVTYIDGTAYVAIGSIKAKLEVADVSSLMSSVTELIGSVTGNYDMPKVDITTLNGIIKSLTMQDEVLNLVLSIDGYDVTALLDLKAGKIHVAATVKDVQVELNITVATAQNSHNITAPTGADKYLNAVELCTVISAATSIVDAGGVTIPAYVTYGEKTYSAVVKATFGEQFAAKITVDALGLDVTLVGDTAYVSMGEIKLCGTLDQVKALYAEISEHYDLPPIDDLLQAIPQDADIQSIIAYALDSVVSLASDNGTIYADVSVNGISANIAMQSDLSELTANVSVNDKTVYITLNPEFGCENIVAPSGDYNSIAELKEMLPAVFALTDSKAFAATFNAGTAYGDGYSVNGNAVIDITDGVKASATLCAFGQTIDLAYVDDVVYLGVQALRFKLSPSQMSTIMPSVNALLGAFGITLPDIDGAVNEFKNSVDLDTIENAMTTSIASVKSFTISGGVITVTVEYEGYGVTLDIDCSAQDGVTLTVGAAANGIDLSLNLTLTPTDKTVTVPDGEYSHLAELAPALDAAAEIISKGGIHTVATVTMGNITLNAAIDCTIEDGTLKAIVKEDSLGLTVVLLGNTAYIEVGGIKVSGQLGDITDIIDAVIPNLPDVIRPYVAEMNRQMMGIIPSGDEFTTNGKTDIAKAVDTVLAMITALSVNDGNIDISISRNSLAATLGITTDLSCANGNVTFTFNGIGGPFGECYTMAIGLGLQQIAASTVTVPSVNPDEYVKASDILAAIDCVLPLVKQSAFDLGVSVTVYGQTITGDVYIDLGEYTLDTIAVQAQLDVAGAPVTISVVNKTLYLDVNNGSVRLVQPLNKSAIKELVAQIDQALPELGLNDKVTSLLDSFNEDMAISDVLNNITLSPTQNGMALAATFGKTAVNADIVIADNVLNAINVNCNIDGKQVDVALDVQTADGVLCGVQTTQADIMGVTLGLSLTVTSAEQHAVQPDGDYMEISELIPFISPVMDLIDTAMTAKTITVNVSDCVLTVNGKSMAVNGVIYLTLDPIAVSARLTLFYGTDDALDLIVIYENDVVYIEVGKIKLSFNVATDMAVINDAITKYLPEYLSLKDIGAMLSSISSLINDIKSIASADGVEEILGIMFSQDNAYGKSMIVRALDMIRLGKFNDAVTASAIVMDSPFTVTVDVVPVISNGKLDFKLGVKASNLLSLNLTAKLAFSDTPLGTATPADTTEYTPVVEFVNAVINAVNTLTAKVPDKITTDEDGNVTTVSQIAFSVDAFAFDYDIFKTVTTVDENGETVEVKDDAGRPAIATDDAGNKIVKQHIDVSNVDGQKALRFSMTTTTVKGADGKETKSTRLAVEAHITIGIKDGDGNAKTGFPIELNLYVQPLDTEEQGFAYLYYKEANGYGEKISIDYTSIMQLAAAVLDILSVDDKTVESLLGEYRLDIDKTVFESMAISGLDSIKDLLNNLVKAVDEAKLALGDAKAAWSRLQNAGSIDALIYEMLNDEKSVDDETEDGETVTVTENTIKTLLDSAISHLKAAIVLFQTDNGTDDEDNEDSNQINGALFGKVVNAVYFSNTNSALSAYVDNKVATGTSGWATVEVASSGDKINSIGVDNLDVNTAKLNTFDMQFSPITEVLTVTIPDDYTTETNSKDSYKVMYSDFANIKHLLFDVMNTANMMEFEIGGGSGDKINLNFLNLLKVDISYRAKVYILDQGKNANPRYKTAADIQLNIPETVALGIPALPKCTTRLFFYDNVLYMHGVESWKAEWKWIKYNWTVNEKDYKFTVDELINIAGEVDENGNKVGIEKLFKKFVFRLLPLAEKAVGVNIHEKIIDAVKNPPEANPDLNTIAQIFKQYKYTTDANGKGVHELIIGLKELALNGSLRDATVKLTGANDGDDNVYDNFISTLWLQTSFGTDPEKDSAIATITLDATLTNTKIVPTTYYFTDKELTIPSKDNTPTDYYFTRNELESTALSQTVIDGVGYSFGKTCSDNPTPNDLMTYLNNNAWNAMDW